MASTAPASPPASRSALSALALFFERRTPVLLALGFLIFDTLSAWLRSSGLSLEVIGFFSLVTLVFSFKSPCLPAQLRTGIFDNRSS